MTKIKIRACPVYLRFVDIDASWDAAEAGYSFQPTDDDTIEFEDKAAVARWLRGIADTVEAT